MDLTMDGTFDQAIEGRSCFKLIAMGSLIDSYIGQLGNQFLKKLSYGRATGLLQSTNVFIPFQIFMQLTKLCQGYGAELVTETKKKALKKLVVTIDQQDYLKTIFHPKRVGFNCLAKRKFQKVHEGGKCRHVLNGQTRVVVTKATPGVITYLMQQQTCKITFYIQRYNKNGEAIDATLQATLNGG